MRRLSHNPPDRGATAVFVALMLTVLMGFGALSVDIGTLWSDKQQLQNGADAGALAVAQACAAGACGSYAATANSLAAANKVDGNATGTVTTLDLSARRVTVRTDTTRELWFARILGVNSAGVDASATATWGPQSSGTFLPLAFSLCAFWGQSGTTLGDPIPSGTPMTLYLKSTTDVTGSIVGDPSLCLPNLNSAHNEVAGGFGWLVPEGASCTSTVAVGGWVTSSPGASPPCALGTSLQNQTVQFPIFDECAVGPSGNCVGGHGAKYHVYAIASFKLTGYCFNNSNRWNVAVCNNSTGPNGARVIGNFVSSTTTGGGTTGGPSLGTNLVTLAE